MAKVTAQIFSPHSPEQRQIMFHLAQRETQFLWVACGTKFGKTLGAAGGFSYAAPRSRKAAWRWVAPIFKQTRIAWKYIDQILPGPPHVTKNKTDMVMTIPRREVEMQFWHGVHPEDLEGEAIWGQVNDECAKLKQQVFDSSLTTWTFTQAPVINISTPRGRNWFYKGCMRAKGEMEAAAREGRIPREVFITAPTAANPYVPRASIIEAKRLLPDRLFRQYYLAEFIDDGNTFPQLLLDRENWLVPYEPEGPIEYWIHPKASEMSVVAGCDWAKKRDFTVLTVWDYSVRPFRIVGFLRYQGKRYTEQVVDIAKFLRRFKDCEMLYHDKTGVGEAIDDMLSQVPGLTYLGITFSNASKAEMVNQMITATERQEIIFPWWKELLKEFEVFEVETDLLGRMRYSAPEGAHDDIVVSCILGLAACQEYADKDFEVTFLDDLKTKDLHKDSWENYIYESLDIDPDEGF